MHLVMILIVVSLLVGVAAAFIKFLVAALACALAFFLLLAWLSSLVK